jgi:hypothetical protein
MEHLLKHRIAASCESNFIIVTRDESKNQMKSLISNSVPRIQSAKLLEMMGENFSLSLIHNSSLCRGGWRNFFTSRAKFSFSEGGAALNLAKSGRRKRH